MPELPEVEVLRKYLIEAVSGIPITGIEFMDKSDKIYESSREEIRNNLLQEKFTDSKRVGKYLFVQISNGRWLFLHFGMTGSLEFFREQETPEYTRLLIEFKDGGNLAFIDPRKFGSIAIIEDPKKFQEQRKLGTDLLEISEEEFIDALKNRTIGIKAALLQQKHFSGIGNWIADEMLFETGIHPDQSCGKLTDKQLKELLRSGKNICEVAIKADTHYGQFPKNFFYNYRRKGAIHPDYPNSPIERLKSGGRTTYIIKERQKLR